MIKIKDKKKRIILLNCSNINIKLMQLIIYINKGCNKVSKEIEQQRKETKRNSAKRTIKMKQNEIQRNETKRSESKDK